MTVKVIQLQKSKKLLNNIAPLGLEHLNFLGEYTFNLRNITHKDDLRTLNIGI